VCLFIYLTHEFLKIEAAETNKCSKQCSYSQAFKHTVYDENWFDITEEERKAYFALCSEGKTSNKK
jgi:hypothetical protein